MLGRPVADRQVWFCAVCGATVERFADTGHARTEITFVLHGKAAQHSTCITISDTPDPSKGDQTPVAIHCHGRRE